MKLVLVGILVLSTNGFAQGPSSNPKAGGSLETLVKKARKDRKKKAEMCHECGKPEEQCDCKGEEHKKKN